MSDPQGAGVEGASSEAIETVEQALYRTWRNAPKPRPNVKEIREAFAFFQRIDKLLFPSRSPKALVIDACASHGLVALLLLIYRRATKVICLDPNKPASFATMVAAWGVFIQPEREVYYDESTLTESLSTWLDTVAPFDAAVVGVHACQHLSVQIVDECLPRGTTPGMDVFNVAWV